MKRKYTFKRIFAVLLFTVAVFAATLLTASAADAKVCYVRTGGTGDGSAPDSAFGSLRDAYGALAKEGGTIVLVGNYKVASSFVAPAHEGTVTLTSVYGGADYRKTASAALVLGANYYLGGPTVFDELSIVSEKGYASLVAAYQDLTIGADVVCSYSGASKTYPCLAGGSYKAASGLHGTVTIGGGTWQRVRIGNTVGVATDVSVHVTVCGGEILECVYFCSNDAAFTGSEKLTVIGGTLYGGIAGIGFSAGKCVHSGEITIELLGGTVCGTISPKVTNYGSFTGTWNVSLIGGNFTRLTDVRGTDGLCPEATSTLFVASDVDLDAEQTGTYTFQNPIRTNGADPWLFYYDGNYYYIATGGPLKLYKAANIGDLKYAVGVTIYTPEAGHEWSHNLWSPEIHYFTDAEVGEGNGGWYCFLGSDGGGSDFSGQREYVIKCLDGDNLQGRWGNPVTGEVNVPRKVNFRDSDYNVNELCGGIDVIKINGKKYFLFVSEVGRETSGTVKPNFYQTINIAEFENPWTVIGTPVTICVPQYTWEKGGSSDGIHPQVVEGSTAVYGSDGSVFIVYSGSGYWTTNYSLGYLRYLGGDPMDKANWEKYPIPILQKSGELNGCGHASYTTDTSGQGWICYHAYIGKDTSSGRYAFVETYTANSTDGVVIGEGTRKPASPDTVYTANVNATPLGKRISGFTKRETVSPSGTTLQMTLGSAAYTVNGAQKTMDVLPLVRFDRTMLPVRYVAEALGAAVTWDGGTSTATIIGKDTVLEITVGAATAKVNGESVSLDSPAFIDNNRTYMPVRFVAENLGAKVTWDSVTSTATITLP